MVQKTKKKRASARSKVKIQRQIGNRETKREQDRQDAETKEAIDEGELPYVVGFDERTTDSERYFHPEDMLRLLVCQMKVERELMRQKQAKSELENAELAYLKRQLEIGKRHSDASLAQVKALGELRRLHAALEDAYDIKLSKVSFDDETGLIREG